MSCTFFVLLGIMFLCLIVFLSALLYVLLPSGVINHVHVCMYVCMYVCTYVRTYVRMYVRMYVCIIGDMN